MIWGYAGVPCGEFNWWDGDSLLNKLDWMGHNGFESTGVPIAEMRDSRRRDQIVELVERHDLKCTVGPHVKWCEVDADTVKRVCDEFIEDLRTYRDLLRVPICTTTPGGVHRFLREPSLDEQMDMLARRLAPVAAVCKEMGCPLGIENHGDYYGSDLATLCQRVDGLGIFLDTGNTFLIGEKSVEGCRDAAPYTIGTHFKDHYVAPHKQSPLSFAIGGAPLGAGDVGLREIFHDLMRLAPEPDKLVMQWEMVPPKGMDGNECLAQSWAFVRELQKEAGR